MAPPGSEPPGDYAEVLARVKDFVVRERLRGVVAANAATVLLYWNIGKVILERQFEEG